MNLRYFVNPFCEPQQREEDDIIMHDPCKVTDEDRDITMVDCSKTLVPETIDEQMSETMDPIDIEFGELDAIETIEFINHIPADIVNHT
jgi:hypothetical protein